MSPLWIAVVALLAATPVDCSWGPPEPPNDCPSGISCEYTGDCHEDGFVCNTFGCCQDLGAEP
jgi:hypothetical protein